MMSEEVILRTADVQISPTLVKFGDVTAHTADIQYVELGESETRSLVGLIMMGVAVPALLIGLAAIAGFFGGAVVDGHLLPRRSIDGSIYIDPVFIHSFLIGFAGLLLGSCGHKLSWQKYRIILRIGGKDRAVFAADNRASVNRVKAALDRAIAMRG
ncbi:MAG TPA: DUF6232 family protein [Methylocystis sp.]|nr:DUF6232 family protein [Methylocystis sp.]